MFLTSKETLLEIFTANAEQLKQDVNELTARDRLLFFTKILPFIATKEVERVEVAQLVEQPLFADVADDEILNGD